MFRIKLKEVRKTKGIRSQHKLSDLILQKTGHYMAQQTISDIENGSNTNLATLAIIADALECRVVDLIEE